jgi:hypothetical protein
MATPRPWSGSRCDRLTRGTRCIAPRRMASARSYRAPGLWRRRCARRCSSGLHRYGAGDGHDVVAAFKTGATEAASWAAEMLGVADTVEGIRLGLTDPAVLARWTPRTSGSGRSGTSCQRGGRFFRAHGQGRCRSREVQPLPSATSKRRPRSCTARRLPTRRSARAAPRKRPGTCWTLGTWRSPGPSTVSSKPSSCPARPPRPQPRAEPSGRPQLFAERELRYEREARAARRAGQRRARAHRRRSLLAGDRGRGRDPAPRTARPAPEPRAGIRAVAGAQRSDRGAARAGPDPPRGCRAPEAHRRPSPARPRRSAP